MTYEFVPIPNSTSTFPIQFLGFASVREFSYTVESCQAGSWTSSDAKTGSCGLYNLPIKCLVRSLHIIADIWLHTLVILQKMVGIPTSTSTAITWYQLSSRLAYIQMPDAKSENVSPLQPCFKLAIYLSYFRVPTRNDAISIRASDLPSITHRTSQIWGLGGSDWRSRCRLSNQWHARAAQEDSRREVSADVLCSTLVQVRAAACLPTYQHNMHAVGSNYLPGS